MLFAKSLVALGVFGLSSTVLAAEQVTFGASSGRSGRILESGVKLANKVLDGKTYQAMTHDALPSYTLNVLTDPLGNKEKLCDSGVEQITGYLNIGTKNLFFWFFESRSKPSVDPLVLWLNGGPGCSSSTGLLFELGPCSITENGTVYNKHSWNSGSNIIFLDQPVEVGYSYSTGGDTVGDSQQAAEDVYAFLTLFISTYRKYSALPFHVSGESYAGTYIPNIASVILKHNKALKEAESLAGEFAPIPTLPVLNFASVLIGNGLTDPLIQMPSVYDYACLGPYHVFEPDGVECEKLKSKVPTCERLVSSCYKTGSRFSCVPAALYCWSQMFGSFQQLGLNPYNVEMPCDRSEDADGPLCYKQMGWVENYLNKPEIKETLGVPSSVDFQSCNMAINQRFMGNGDGMHNSAAFVTDILEAGVRVLIYAGELDFMCNYIGNYEWVKALPSIYNAEFNAAPKVPYVTLGDKKKKERGSVQVAGAQNFTAGALAYVSVLKAGHMVPYDQPEVALDLFMRWINDTPLVLDKPE